MLKGFYFLQMFDRKCESEQKGVVEMIKGTVVFDFDGVIHSYKSGWKGVDVIPDPPVEGIAEALRDIYDAGYDIMVVSTRCCMPEGRFAISKWLGEYGLIRYIHSISAEKPPAIVYIDDRAICFDGKPDSLLGEIENFKPWNQ